jgi:hypothetical protein
MLRSMHNILNIKKKNKKKILKKKLSGGRVATPQIQMGWFSHLMIYFQFFLIILIFSNVYFFKKNYFMGVLRKKYIN